MRFDIVTIFPDFFAGPLDYGIVRRAREAGLVKVLLHQLREFTQDRHRTVDDRPFGGGEGMVLKPEPIFACVEALGVDSRERRLGPGSRETVILLSAAGCVFNQDMAAELAQLERVVLICGRYEGVDERVADQLADREVSIGDFVLSGGELAAALIVDATTRLLPGALGNEQSTQQESFTTGSSGVIELRKRNEIKGDPASEIEGPSVPLSTVASGGLLDYPHYTRPAEFRGAPVPEVLLSGNHDEIRRWRRRRAMEKTLRNRPDLLERVSISDEDRVLIAEISGRKV